MQVIIQTIVTNSMAENAHVVCVKDTREAFVADPGGAADEIIEACEAQGCRLTDILLTHGHFDHVGAVRALKAATGAPHLPPLDDEVYEGGGTSEQIETIRAVHDYLTQHLSSRVTIDELSRRFLMNPSTMKALFKSVYGSSLASHIREHRMQHAAKLLLEGDENVAQVARAVGYESQSKFSTEFHKAFGVLPTEYRKSQKK